MITKQKTWSGIAGLVVAAICCLTMTFSCQSAFALETPDDISGEELNINDEQAFQDQDIEYESTADNEASTSYYLISKVEETTSVAVVPAETSPLANDSSSLAKSGDAFPSSLLWPCVSAILASLSLMMSLRFYRQND